MVMNRVRGWIKLLRAAVRPGAAEREMRDELAFHLEQETERNIQRGMPPAAARRAARLSFGPVEAVKDELRTSGLRGMTGETFRDLRHAVIGMRRRPTLAVAVIATLGLGIGVSTAMFSVVHGVVLRPLPYPDSDRLVAVWETYPGWRTRPVLSAFWDRIGLAWPDFDDWRARQRTFDDVAVFARTQMTAAGSQPEVLDVGLASASLWRVLGVQPPAGRAFAEHESGPGAPAVAVIAHSLSAARFGGPALALGKTLDLDGRGFTIIGVLDPAFRFSGERSNPADVWIPAGAAGRPMGEQNHFLTGIGRLRRGVRLEAASEETTTVFLGERRPGARGASLRSYHQEVVGTSRSPLLMLLAGTFVMLLIACVNAAALLAGDAARRDREVATRRALGATRGRIVRQFVAEGLAMSLLAAAAGIGLAALCVPALIALAPPDLPRLDEIGIRPGVLAFAVAGALLTTVVCSVTSVVVIDGRRRAGMLSSVERVTGGGRRAQPVFVGVQLALLTVMVTAAALLGRSLLGVRAIDPGFAIGNLLTAAVDVPAGRYETRAQLAAFYNQLLERVRALPGVVAASGASSGPFADGSESTSVGLRGLADNVAKPEMQRRVVLNRYFETMRIPVLSGTPPAGAAPTVAVSKAMAARLWPNAPAIGKEISLRDQWYTVQAVVEDIRDQALNAAPQPTYYVTLQAAPDERLRMRLMLRTAGDPSGVASLLRGAVKSVDASVPVTSVETMAALVSRSLALERYRTLLVNIFAGASLLLAAVGIFGVTLRTMLRRRREIGVRLALGARPARLMTRAIARTAAGATAGVAIGAALSLLLMPALSEYLYGLSARDAGTYIASAGLLFVVCLAAAAIPVARATRVNVVEVLRED
jgi:predicted permease